MSSLDEAIRKAKEAVKSLADVLDAPNMKSLRTLPTVALNAVLRELDIQLRREELFNDMASLSSLEFAEAVQMKTDAARNGYGIENELHIQEQICMLLEYDAMSQDEILEKLDDGSFKWFSAVLSMVMCMPPAPMKNVYGEWPCEASDGIIRAYASGTIVQPVNASNWKRPSVASVQKYIQEADEPARKNIWRQNDEQENQQEENPDAVDQGSGENGER